MTTLFRNILTASFHGSIVIGAVLILRLVLRKAPRKYICYLWLLAGVRLLMPFEIRSDLSLQPGGELPWVLPDWSVLIPWIWLAVGGAFLIYSLHSYVNLRKKVRRSVKIPGGWEAEGIDTAFILGFVKPRIYIPVGMAPEARKHILAHERTHLDKGDHWIKMIGFLALALHWFNPLVWAAYILLCRDIEMACDERVVQFMELPERKEYSSALLSCSSNRIHYAASPVAFGEVSVKSRIQSILHYRKPSFWVGLLSVGAIAFVTLCLVTSPTEPAPGAAPVIQETVSPEAVQPAQPGFVPGTSIPMTDNPDWGLGLVAEATSPTTMTIRYGVGVSDVPWDGTPLYKDYPYVLEKWNGASWEDIPTLVKTPSYMGLSSIELSKDNAHGFYQAEQIDWSLIYGALPQGDYRVGLYITRNGEERLCYAWFPIYANALAGEEAEALARCENALELLTRQDSYDCLISQATGDRELIPVQEVIKTAGSCRVDRYYGEYCYSNVLCQPTDDFMSQWDDSFRLGQNKHISFPEGVGKISPEQVCFLSQWTDVDGVVCRETNTYCFDEYGKLSSIDCVMEKGEAAEPEVLQRRLTVRDAPLTAMPGDLVTESVKDSWTAAEESPWGILFRVDDDLLKPTGGEVWLNSGHTIGVTDYTTDSSYWLERKRMSRWEKLPAAGEPAWGTQTYRLSSRGTIIQVDWREFYGELEPGHYRMGKHFHSGEESAIQYAEFVIAPEGDIYGQGAREAIARVDAALEKLRSGSYHITKKHGGGFRAPMQTDTVCWKYDGTCVTDFYDYYRHDGYTHSLLTEPDDANADLFYDYLLQNIKWHGDYNRIYFSQALSVISPREISFAVSSSRSAVPSISYYSFFFDDAGDLTHFTWEFVTAYDTGRGINLYTVEPTQEHEIQAWVETIRARQG